MDGASQKGECTVGEKRRNKHGGGWWLGGYFTGNEAKARLGKRPGGFLVH